MQHPRVTLTREHRDAIREHISGYFHSGPDLALLDTRPDNQDEARDIILRLSRSVRVLDQIGWQHDGTCDTYTLELDPETIRLLEYIDASARGSIHVNRDWLQPRQPGSRLTPEQYEDDAASARRMIDIDLDAVDAVRLVREQLGAST